MLRLPFPDKEASDRGITKSQWNILVSSTFPNAELPGILLAWDYASEKKLSAFDGHLAIVKQRRFEKSNQKWVDFETVWPTVKSQTILAHRTGSSPTSSFSGTTASPSGF